MNEIKKENYSILTARQWRLIQQMETDKMKWKWVNDGLGKRYNFWLERSHLSPERIFLWMNFDGGTGADIKLQILELGNEFSYISKQMLAIGWQSWIDKKNK